MEDLTGKHILITGGSTGIGYQIIRKCLEQGATKIVSLDICDIDNALVNLQTEFPNQEIVYIQTDVGNKANVLQSFKTANTRFGYLDIVIGNAGICDENRPEITIQVNLFGIIYTTNAAIDLMSKAKGGRGGIILNVASVAGLKAVYSTPSYSASKHGVIGFTNAFSHESNYTKNGLKFLTICPGYTKTTFNQKTVKIEIDEDAYAELCKNHSLQTADQAAEGFLYVLRNASHGTLWKVEGGEVVEVTK